MYYRRKVLLALLEAFGGLLTRTDCQKLLFLFCQYTNRNYYDFFPYKYGSFSLLAYQDKRRLTDLGFLKDSDDFALKGHQNFIACLKKEDMLALNSLAVELKELRGGELIKKAYIEYPQYTSRSEIIHNILTKDEIQRIQLFWNKDNSSCLFTLGYEGLTIDSYLHILISNNISIIIDVRKNPLSMKYGFSKNLLKGFLGKTGIEYLHLPELGVPSEFRQNLKSQMSYKRLFEQYVVDILPKQTAKLEQIRDMLEQKKRVALTCFENDYHYCHRHKITEYLDSISDFHTRIVHL